MGSEFKNALPIREPRRNFGEREPVLGRRGNDRRRRGLWLLTVDVCGGFRDPRDRIVGVLFHSAVGRSTSVVNLAECH